MKVNMKSLIYFPIFFLFLPSFSFYMPGLKVFEFYFVSLYVALVYMLICDYKATLTKLKLVIKKTPLIYYLLFLILICLNSICLSVLGVTSISRTIIAILFKFLLGILPSIFYFICLIDKYISVKNFLQLFLKLFWISLVLGIIAYLGRYFNISIINNIFDFFANSRHVATSISSYNPDAAHYFKYGKRLTGLHAEPGYLGQFLYIFLPFLYTFSKSKFRIFMSKYSNFICKITIIPLTWLNILLTKSPISLLMCIAITLLYYRKNVIHFIIKTSWLIVPIVIIMYLSISNIDLTTTYLGRILKVIQCFKSYELFVIVEPSLATRISSYINEFYVFLHHPIMGIGIDNIGNYIYKQFLNSPVPLTEEIVVRNVDAISRSSSAFVNKGFIYTILAENGIFITLSLFFAYYKTLYSVIKCSHFNKHDQIYNDLIKSLKYSLTGILFLFIYDLYLVNKFYNLVLALSFLIIYHTKIMLAKSKYKQNIYGGQYNEKG